jgi:hypothetical protein
MTDKPKPKPDSKPFENPAFSEHPISKAEKPVARNPASASPPPKPKTK